MPARTNARVSPSARAADTRLAARVRAAIDRQRVGRAVTLELPAPPSLPPGVVVRRLDPMAVTDRMPTIADLAHAATSDRYDAADGVEPSAVEPAAPARRRRATTTRLRK